MKIFITIFILIFILFVILLISAMVTDFHYFSKVWDSKTPEELKNACLIDWYKNGNLDDLPAQCRQFYSQGINEFKK